MLGLPFIVQRCWLTGSINPAPFISNKRFVIRQTADVRSWAPHREANGYGCAGPTPRGHIVEAFSLSNFVPMYTVDGVCTCTLRSGTAHLVHPSISQCIGTKNDRNAVSQS